jgi:hypothetical protein
MAARVTGKPSLIGWRRVGPNQSIERGQIRVSKSPSCRTRSRAADYEDPVSQYKRVLSGAISQTGRITSNFARQIESHATLRGSIPSFFRREISVVRLMSMRAAAPSGPPTRPFVTFRVRTISSRSSASRVLASGAFLPL